MQLFPEGKTYDFMARRGALAWLSVFMVLGSIGLMFVPGPKLGTDFKGGTELELAFKSKVGDVQIRDAVSASGFSQPQVIQVTDENNPYRFLIRVQEGSTFPDELKRKVQDVVCFGDNLPADRCPEAKQAKEVKFSPGGEKITVRFSEEPDLEKVRTDMLALSLALREGDAGVTMQNARDNRVEILIKSKGDQLLDGLRQQLGDNVVPVSPLRVEWVGPKAGAQLRDSALKSLAISLVFVMLYIAFRFDLRFSPGAVLALMHDAIVTVGVLTLMQRELNLATVAAILTIVGYSVNDTVVVYDRVRENLGKLRGSTFTTIINRSLSEMLNRTMVTSMTTILSLLMFFLWGTGALKDFSLTLIIGIGLGTYSSIYVALPLTDYLDRKFFAKVAANKTARTGPMKKKASAVV